MSRRVRRSSARRRRERGGVSHKKIRRKYVPKSRRSRRSRRSRSRIRSRRSRRSRRRNRRSRGGFWNPLSRSPRGFRRKGSRPQYVPSEMEYDYSLRHNKGAQQRRRSMHGMGTKSGSCSIM